MKPYVKKYENGILVNPITKENPYLHPVTVSIKNMLKYRLRFRIWRRFQNNYFVGKTASFY